MRFPALLNFLFGAGAMVAYPVPAIKMASRDSPRVIRT
jgi:hypothetical protein